MSDWSGIRGDAFTTAGLEKATDAFLVDCRQVLLTSDPSMAQVARPQFIQAMISLALQRLMHWSSLHSDEAADADEIPTQSMIGAFTGLGIATAMFHYDPEQVLRACIPAMGRAWEDAQEMLVTGGSDAPVN